MLFLVEHHKKATYHIGILVILSGFLLVFAKIKKM